MPANSKKKRPTGSGRPKGHPQLGEGLEFMRVLWELDHNLRLASKNMEKRLGITGPQRLVVRLVGKFPGLTAGELATWLHIDPSTLTGVLGRLERMRLLVRSSDGADRRRARFHLTANGRRLDRSRVGTVEAAVNRALEGQPSARIRGARELLTAVALALDASTGN